MSGMIHALIIDDEPDNRLEIASYLKNLNHRFDEVGSVEEAKASIAAGRYDYVVLDLRLPQEPGSPAADVNFGKRLLDEILERHAGLPVLVVSGYGNDTNTVVDIMKRQRAGALVPFLKKPFAAEGNSNILQEITELLSHREQRAGRGAKPGSKRGSKPAPTGWDEIDLACTRIGHWRYRIQVNGKPVEITQQMLNALAVFGDAQKAFAGKKQARHHAFVPYEAFGIGVKGEDSQLSAMFSKLKKRLWEHLHESILLCKRGEYAWVPRSRTGIRRNGIWKSRGWGDYGGLIIKKENPTSEPRFSFPINLLKSFRRSIIHTEYEEIAWQVPSILRGLNCCGYQLVTPVCKLCKPS